MIINLFDHHKSSHSWASACSHDFLSHAKPRSKMKACIRFGLNGLNKDYSSGLELKTICFRNLNLRVSIFFPRSEILH